MRLTDFNPKKVKVLRNVIAFKWIRVDSITTKHLKLYLPEDFYKDANAGVDRLGHKHTCEALAIGPDVHTVKPGNRFLLHEYDKIGQGENWNEQDIMFCEEEVIPCILPKDMAVTIPAKEITDKMMDEYENH